MAPVGAWPAVIANVISRVTGGERSDINGALRSTIPRADLFFLNPAGVVFGPNATLDVQGSFHVSTADEVRFADGAIFSASHPDASSFTVAAPEAFEFLSAEPGDLVVDRSRLSVPAGEALSLIGGDLRVTAGNNGYFSGGGDGMVRAEAGEITLTALGSPGAVAVADGGITAGRGAAIRLADQAVVDVGGNGGGTVRVRGGRLVVENRSFILARNTGPADARGLELDVGRLELQDGAQVTALTLGPGAGGDLRVVADEVVAAGAGSGLYGNSEGTGPDAGAGGTIALDVGSRGESHAPEIGKRHESSRTSLRTGPPPLPRLRRAARHATKALSVR